MQRAVFVLCLLIWGCGCGRVRENAEARDAIIRNNANAVRWYAEGNADALAGMCAADAWQMPPNHSPLAGREAIREFWRQALRWGKWEFAFDTQRVDVNGPLAVERGKYVLRFTAGPDAPHGMVSFEDRGNYLVHWRLEADGQWRAVGDAPVSELPIPGVASPAKSTP